MHFVIASILQLLLIMFLLFFVVYLIYVYFLQAGAVYQPSSKKAVEKMLKMAKVGKGDVVIDLGSGDGRILIAAAKLGAKAIGYEIDPILAFQSRKRIEKTRMSHLAKVHCKSFWQADFNQATIITLYLLPRYMDKLKKVLRERLTHSVSLVSNIYQLPGKKHIKKSGNIYLYKFP